jgi:hypothetical protein
MPIPSVQNNTTSVSYQSATSVVGPKVISGTYDSINIVSGSSFGPSSTNNVAIFYAPNPSFDGTDYITYTVQNTSGTSALATITINVAQPTLTSTPSAGALPSGVLRDPYSVTFGATGGYPGTNTYPDYQASLTSGALPTGLTLFHNVLSGTPTVASTYNFAITVTDSSDPTPASVTTNYSLAITLPKITLNVTPNVYEGGTVYVSWSVSYAADAVINLSNLSGTLNIIDQPLVGGVTFTAPNKQIFDSVMATLKNRTPSTFITSTSSFYTVKEALKPLSSQLPSSKFSQTSNQWNKAPVTVPPQLDWKPWGLFRAYIGSSVPGWGSDSIQDTEGTVSIDYNGQNVDVVVIGRGSPNRTHPEFTDVNGNSRIKYYNWFVWNSTVNGAVPNGTYADSSYYTHEANQACAVASIVAGNEYGWARGANVYSLDYTQIPSNGYPFADAFKYVNLFHRDKSINPVTGVKNPTIVVTSSILPNVLSPSNEFAVNYQGTGYGPSTFTTATLESYNISTPYLDISDSRIYTTSYDSTDMTSAVTDCINSGIIVVGPAGDYANYVDIPTGPNYNNTIHIGVRTWYYNRGPGFSSVPGVICVGSMDATSIEKESAFTGVGPRLNLFAPGSNLMASFNSKLGVYSDIVGETPPTMTDPRNELFSIGKVSGTLYAAAQVAGFLACLAQLQPSLTPSEALSYVTTNAGVNQLSTGSTATIITTSVQLYESRNPAYCTFLNTYGVWPNQNLNSPAGFGDAGKVTVTFTFNAPLATSNYKLSISADNDMIVYLNGVNSTNYITSQGFYNQSIYENVTLNAGSNILVCNVYNYHGPGSFGVFIQDSFNNQIFATSPYLKIATPNLLKSSPNLTLFGFFPVINERVKSVSAVTNNQKFNISISGGTPNGAYQYSVRNITTGTGFLDSNGSAIIVNQSFVESGIKEYEFTFINSTNVLLHTVEVIDHNPNEIVSTFTQTGRFWNKTPDYIVPDTDWLNWGLLRSTTSTNATNWGSDSSIIDASGTVTVPYTGLNVDIIVLDEGSVDPLHPEFALYSDGTGNSRVKYFNWLKYNFSLGLGANGSYDDSTYYKSVESNKACSIASIAAGNTYGWARAANIYTLNYKLLPRGNSHIEDAFNYIIAFHNDKQINAINPLTGVANPTIVIAGWATHLIIPSENINQVDYHGSAVPFTIPQLQEYGIITPYISAGNTATYITVKNNAIDTAVSNAVSSGIVVFSTPGDYASYAAKDDADINWNNRILDNTGGTYFYNRGTSPGTAPGVICVGAIDSTVAQQKAGYSGNGPRVDIFAPGSDQISAESSIVGIYSDITGLYSPTYTDPRNPDYFIGKGKSTAFASANVAGYAACLLQLYPKNTATDILNLITDNSLLNGIVINNVGFGVNNDLNGSPNRLMQAKFPNYDEIIYTSVNGSSSTAVVVGDNFDFHITNADPGTRYYFSGTDVGEGVIDHNGNATTSTVALKNSGLYVYKFYFASTNHLRVISFNVKTTDLVSNRDIIYANDFNRIQNRVNYFLSNIYGKAPKSSQRTVGELVTASHWQAVYDDIQSANIHQNGANAQLPFDYPVSGYPNSITAATLNGMTTVIDSLINNYEVIAEDQIVLARIYSNSTVTTGVYESFIQEYTWPVSTSTYPNPARNFFNLGGYIEIAVENTILGPQTGRFTLRDYISSYGYVSLPIPGGHITNTMSVNGVNGNIVTLETVVAPNLGSTAFSTGTVKVFASTSATGGIASPQFSSTVTIAQGQLNVTPITFVPIYGNTITTSTFNVYNNYGSEITVSEVKIKSDTNRMPLNIVVNTPLPFIVTSTYSLSVSFQNVEPGGDPGLYENSIELISDGPNPSLVVPVPVQANFGIVVKPNPYFRTVTKPTTSTFEIVSYAGTFSSYTVISTKPSVGFQVINPGVNYTYFNLDDTLGKATMSLLLYNSLFRGRRTQGTSAALSSPYNESILVTDVGAVPNLTTSTQLQFVAYPKDITQNAATALVDVEMLVNAKDKHLGHWTSPQNKLNGVIGFSYDIIDGRRALTVGFGMGSGGSVPLYQSDHLWERSETPEQGYGIYSAYAIQQLGRKFYTYLSTGTLSTAVGAWNTGTLSTSTFNTYTETKVYYPDELVPLSTSSNLSSNAFLQTYGVWNGENSKSTTFVNTASFLVRDGGDYTYYFNGATRGPGNSMSASFKIDDGNVINSVIDSTGILKGTVYLTAGIHKIVINATQVGGDNSIASVALTLSDYEGYVVWCTLDSMVPTWAEIGRIFLDDDGNHHSYQIVPNIYSLNVANNTTYSSYFANNSIVTVSDNGRGQLSISMNPVVSAAYDAITDATLSNAPYLFYYYSNSENQQEGNKRFNNYQAPSQYVKYFTGFDPYGKVTTKQVLAPGYIAPPLIIIQYYSGGGGDKKPLWEQVLIDVVLVGIIIYGAFVLVSLGLLSVGGAGFGYFVAGELSLGWDAFTYWISIGAPGACFTWDTEVLMEDGTVKNISDVKVGDRVYNFDMSKINTVTHLEIAVATELMGLYSPDREHAPFATINHPLYINGVLSSIHTQATYDSYPWLGKTAQLTPMRSGPMYPGETMYNLWIDGDGTYTVNGYGTTSIIGEGGILKLSHRHGFIEQESITELFNDFASEGTETAYGGYIMNNALGKINVKPFTKLAIELFKIPKESRVRKVIYKVAKFIGKQAIKRQEKQPKK